jgi:tyrosyl-tRNA synthetase
MSAFKSDFLNILRERGFVHQCSDFEGLDALAAKGQATAYVGYDCTAPSLHIGNFLTMMMLYWLQQSGNKPVTLMGGGARSAPSPRSKPTRPRSAACSPRCCAMATGRAMRSCSTMPSG